MLGTGVNALGSGGAGLSAGTIAKGVSVKSEFLSFDLKPLSEKGNHNSNRLRIGAPTGIHEIGDGRGSVISFQDALTSPDGVKWENRVAPKLPLSDIQ